MPKKSKDEDRKQENEAHIISTSTVYSQPWWRGNGNNVMPSPMEHINSAATMGVIPSQANGDGGDKESHAAAAQQSGNHCLFFVIIVPFVTWFYYYRPLNEKISQG